jgi:hypothetical protein
MPVFRKDERPHPAVRVSDSKQTLRNVRLVRSADVSDRSKTIAIQ